MEHSTLFLDIPKETTATILASQIPEISVSTTTPTTLVLQLPADDAQPHSTVILQDYLSIYDCKVEYTNERIKSLLEQYHLP